MLLADATFIAATTFIRVECIYGSEDFDTGLYRAQTLQENFKSTPDLTVDSHECESSGINWGTSILREGHIKSAT